MYVFLCTYVCTCFYVRMYVCVFNVFMYVCVFCVFMYVCVFNVFMYVNYSVNSMYFSIFSSYHKNRACLFVIVSLTKSEFCRTL